MSSSQNKLQKTGLTLENDIHPEARNIAAKRNIDNCVIIDTRNKKKKNFVKITEILKYKLHLIGEKTWAEAKEKLRNFRKILNPNSHVT